MYTVMIVEGSDINTADDYTAEYLSVINEATINGTTFSDFQNDVTQQLQHHQEYRQTLLCSLTLTP